MLFQILLLAAIYAAADRFAGGGWPALDAKLPGRAAFWGALAAALVGLVVAGLPGVTLAVAWLAYRTPGWAIFGGSINPTRKQIPATLARHALAIPLAFIAALAVGGSPVLSAAMGAVYAVMATGLAVWYSKEVANGKPEDNTYVELLRGAAFGMMMGFAIVG